MKQVEVKYAPGMRIIVRGEEWLVKKVETNSLENQTLHVIGLSQLVKDYESMFLVDIEDDIEIVDPAKVTLVPDNSAFFRKSKVYIESQWRGKIPTDNKMHIGNKAAMDLMSYQLEPAQMALNKTRQRILIADTVGLGKTLEAGILMSELIARGKGKRILVVTVKSMMTQFQKEMWNRFTIPLVRLDSSRIQSVRAKLPTNYNPFFYYDKTIISVDTLKNDLDYRTHLENAWWDIIVIDEAHNVAKRGDRSSQRSKLASLLANRSDTLIMLTANSSGQMTIKFEADGSGLSYVTEGDQLALEFEAQYHDLGEVCLDDLRERSERLAIANQIAEKQRFHHWELEFADVFEQNSGFDLIIGNPPWIKLAWNETGYLSDAEPLFAIKKYSAKQMTAKRDEVFENVIVKKGYLSEYEEVSGQQNFLNSLTNYSLLEGQQTNLYKCFIPLAIDCVNGDGSFAFVHPDGIFDDPNGGKLRKCIYPKLRYHFQFVNEKLLFKEVSDTGIYSLNVYGNAVSDYFDQICNLFDPYTIDDSYYGEDGEIPGIKTEDNRWNIKGHSHRVVRIGNEELLAIASVYDDPSKYLETRLPRVYINELMEVLTKYSKINKRICDFGRNVYMSQMYDETNAQKAGFIERCTMFPDDLSKFVYSGPHISIGNPLFKTPRRVCKEKADFDRIYLDYIPEDYIQRTNYIVTHRTDDTIESQMTEWGTKYINEYRIATRKMLGLNQERTDLNEIGDADYAYEIKSGSSQEEICGIISSICIDLKREDDLVNARYENGEYIIISNGITIGRAVINDKATTDLLKIYFCD